MAATLCSKHAPALPGHSLTAASTTSCCRRSGRNVTSQPDSCYAGSNPTSYARGLLPGRESHVLGIDRELEAGQKAHAEQAIDALAKRDFGIILDDDRDVLCLQRAQLNRSGSAPFCRAGSVRCIQSDDAV